MTTDSPTDRRAVAAGATGMALVGSSVVVSGLLIDAPLFTAQAARYALAALLLLAIGRAAGRPAVRPRGREWLWLAGVAVSGLVVFNIAVVRGVEHAEPAVIAVAVACAPVFLGVLGPLAQRHRPAGPVLAAAVVVTAGCALVEGAGRSDAAGLGWAAVALACECGFTLFALPVLGRHGALGVSLHAVWLGAAMFAVLGLVVEGPAAVAELTAQQWAASAWLAVAVTAVAFVLWYAAVGRLGPGPAGLLTGIAPVSAALGGAVLGRSLPGPVVWLGISVVIGGLAIGLRAGRMRRPHPGLADQSRADGPDMPDRTRL
ncbi:EamA family transporter [Nakamurella sp.]|uniref:EamA family transporter n=1 Tax=Nakamurella sp. TaxID=1869182 RepID=UPI003783E97A